MWNKANVLLFFLTVSLTIASPVSDARKSIAFAADPAINAGGILAASRDSTNDVLATFPSAVGGQVNIFADWEQLPGVSAIHYTADMQVDCDGVDVSLQVLPSLAKPDCGPLVQVPGM